MQRPGPSEHIPYYEKYISADGNPISPRALAHILAGHVRYHARLLQERYGVGTP